MTGARINTDERTEERIWRPVFPLSSHHREKDDRPGSLPPLPSPSLSSSPLSSSLIAASLWFCCLLCVCILNDSLVTCHFACLCLITLSCHYKTGHAVGDAGAGCQECDTHDDVWNTECEAYHCYLTHKDRDTLSLVVFLTIKSADRKMERKTRTQNQNVKMFFFNLKINQEWHMHLPVFLHE